MTGDRGYDEEDYRRYTQGKRDRRATAANAGQDVRSIRAGTQLSERESAALIARLAELGVSGAEYIRGLILEDLGIQDTARRPAPKQPKNTQQRKGQQS